MMRFPWDQLQTVLFVVCLLSIVLASTDKDFEDAKATLDASLVPLMDHNTGHLLAMPVFTLRSILDSFVNYEIYNYRMGAWYRRFADPITMPSDTFNLSTGTFLNAETADLMAAYLNQMRPFKNFTELTGPILLYNDNQPSKKDLAKNYKLSSTNIEIPLEYEYCVTKWVEERVTLTKQRNYYSSTWINLMRYPVANWYRFKGIKQNSPEMTTFLQQITMCNEAILLLTVFYQVKKSFERDVALKNFKIAYDDFLDLLIEDKTKAHENIARLVAYTVQDGAFYQLQRDIGINDFQVEKFYEFLHAIELIPGEFTPINATFIFENSYFKNISYRVGMSGAKYFRIIFMPDTNGAPILQTPFASIYKGFKMYLRKPELANNSVFKWRQVIHFIISYGYVYKERNLAKVAPVYGSPSKRNELEKQPESPTPPPKYPPFPLSSTSGVMAVAKPSHLLVTPDIFGPVTSGPVTSEQIISGLVTSGPVTSEQVTFGPSTNVTDNGCVNWSCIRNTVVVVALFALALYLHLARNTTDALVTTSPSTNLPDLIPAVAESWIFVIVTLLVVAMFALVGWWWWWSYSRKHAKAKKKKKKFDRKKKKKKTVESDVASSQQQRSALSTLAASSRPASSAASLAPRKYYSPKLKPQTKTPSALRSSQLSSDFSSLAPSSCPASSSRHSSATPTAIKSSIITTSAIDGRKRAKTTTAPLVVTLKEQISQSKASKASTASTASSSPKGKTKTSNASTKQPVVAKASASNLKKIVSRAKS